MLDAYIIEQIRKREEERRRIHERPALQLPIEHDPRPRPKVEPPPEEDEDGPRVIIIDL